MGERPIRCFLALSLYRVQAHRFHLLHVDHFGTARKLNVDSFDLNCKTNVENTTNFINAMLIATNEIILKCSPCIHQFTSGGAPS